jgi:hypothetical protein
MLAGVLKSPIAVPGNGFVGNFPRGRSLGFIGKFLELVEGCKMRLLALF